MRILIITNYFKPDQGAASIILTRLASKLHKRGHQITVLTSLPNYPHGRILDGYQGKFAVVEDRDGIQVIQTWLWATPSPKISRKFLSQITFMVTAIIRGLVLSRPDVMLIEAQPIFTNLAGVFLSRLKGVPYVLDVHDLWPDHMLSIGALTETHLIYRIARWLVNRTYLGASKIVALTPYLEKVIRGYIPPTDKTLTVYSGVDLKQFHPNLNANAFREKYGLGTARIVAYIGTLGTAYDCQTMLDTARRFVNRSDVRFVIMGTGTQQNLVRDQLAKGDLPNVRWIEWVDYDEIPQAWAATYIAFWALHNHPLHRGAVGTKMYEAMASGVPIVAALEGVVADILRESGGGLSVPFNNVEAFSAALQRLLDDDALHQEYSRNSRAYAEAHFDAENAASAYEKLLQDCLIPPPK